MVYMNLTLVGVIGYIALEERATAMLKLATKGRNFLGRLKAVALPGARGGWVQILWEIIAQGQTKVQV
mgnify:CR=1 FL=1